MHLLLDTNILIPLEPTSAENVEPTTRLAADLLRLCADGAHRVSIHPGSLVDLANDPDAIRREVRGALIRKYITLPHPPDAAILPDPITQAIAGTNDAIDNALLAAVFADAADYLVTEDDGLLRKAARIGLRERVITLDEAIATLATLQKRIPPAPPAVEFLPAHALDVTDPIFNSFRAEYADFDDWLAKCRREGRDSWIVRGGEQPYGALAIIKPEAPEALGLTGGARVLKLCSFKVAEAFRGRRYGELLLKTIFDYCAENRMTHIYVEVFEHHAELVTLFEEFGFARRPLGTTRNELVMAKTFVADVAAGELDALEYHVRFGPPSLRLDDGHVLIVPIQPQYHRMLFPDAGPEIPLYGVGVQPYGNAIRKAYLSNATIRAVQPGDTVLFYRSQDLKAIFVAGVVERTIASDDPVHIARAVGQRTVYSLEDIVDMCNQREVLAILFRQDRILRNRIERAELEGAGVMLRPPQTISHVRSEGLEWLRGRIEG